MALTRKMLKEMGISDENIEKIILAHSETVEALKRFKSDSERFEQELNAAREELSMDYRSRYDKLKEQFDSYKTEVEANSLRRKKEDAYKRLLAACGVLESCVNSIVRVTDFDSMQLDENGEIANSETVSDRVASEWSAFIPKTSTIGAKTATPPSTLSDRVFTRDDIRKMSLREINENYAAIKKSLNGQSL